MPLERAWLPWQIFALIVGLLVLVWPVSMPIVETFRQPGAWQVWSELDRISGLFWHTLLVMAGSVFIALLFGSSAAFLLARTNLPGRRLWILLIAIGLFIPLPLLTSGWYLIAQSLGMPLPALWPESRRLLGAMFLHGIMGIPWAALLLGLGLLWIEPELEEEARLYGSFRSVFRRVILPRLWPFIGLAALIVAWPTWHEITVTDFFKVQTLAEEVYLQLNGGSQDEVPRTTAAMLPLSLAITLLMMWALRSWQANCPQRWPSLGRLQQLQLGAWRWIAWAWMLLLTSLILFIPIWGLVDKAGLRYSPQQLAAWSFTTLGTRLFTTFVNQWHVIVQSIVLGLATAISVSAVVLLFVWLARGSQRVENLVWWMASLLWSIPGPLVGLGLLGMIQQLLDLPGHQLWSILLYTEPSPLPNLWVATIRYFPVAWLIIWPISRLLPREWDELAYLDGAGPWQRLWRIYWPNLAGPVIWVGLAIGTLSLGEISASKLVTTPGFLPLSHLIFQQLHAGADTEVAALSLVLLSLILLAGSLLLAWRPYRHLQRSDG